MSAEASARNDNHFDNFYSLHETGSIIRAGRTTLYNLIKEGKLKAFKIGSYNYVRRSEIDRYLLATAKPIIFAKTSH
jgi:excisionase family DNA binding protein